MKNRWENNLDTYLENTLGNVLPAYQRIADLPPSPPLPFSDSLPTLPPDQVVAIELKAIHEKALAILGTDPREETYDQATQYIDNQLRKMAVEPQSDMFSTIIKKLLNIT